MLPKRLRLSLRKKPSGKPDFLIKSSFFKISIKKSDFSANRYACVVSKTVSKKAVERNRLKRIVFSCLLDLHPKLKQGYNMVLILRPSALRVPKEEFCEAMRDAFYEKQLVI